MSEQNEQIYQFDDFRLDVPNRTLLRDGTPVVLQAKAFDMLVVLIERGGRLVEKDDLFSSVWPGQIVEESNLTVQVSALRRALGEGKDNPHYIITVPGHGYRFQSNVLRLNQAEELVIEHHSHSRIVVETETENGAEPGNSVAPANASEFFAGGNPGDISALQAVAVNTRRKAPVSRQTAVLPEVGRPRSQRRWFIAGLSALILFAVAFILYRDLRPRVPVERFQQITIRRLTSDGKAVNAALSPDGKLFAFVLGTKGNPRSLWLGHVSGGEPIALRPLAAVNYPTLKFSADSNSLYYVITGEDDQQGSLFRMRVFGGAPEELREHVPTEITFAPDMKQFVFVRIDKAKKTSTLVISSIDSPGERELATRSLDSPFVSGTTAWSPDSKTIAVAAVSVETSLRAREVLLVTVADGQLKQVTGENYGQLRKVSWLNDHELVIIASEHTLKDTQIWHVSLPAGEVRPINSDFFSYDEPLNLSADGDSLLAIQTQTLTNIWVAPAARLDQAKKNYLRNNGQKRGDLGP